jgi:hypothetical protein
MKKKEEIATMMDKDFESLLAQTNQLEDFQNGEIQCRICHRQIVIDNVGIVLPIQGKEGKIYLEFICNDPDCLTSN